MLKRILLIFLLILPFTSKLFPQTIYIPADRKTIQEGINQAANGDTVLIAPGIYKENQ